MHLLKKLLVKKNVCPHPMSRFFKALFSFSFALRRPKVTIFEVLGKRETLQVLVISYLQGFVVLGTGVEVRSTRANTLMAQTFRSSNKHIICSRNRQLR